jgi:hypothetical protein
MPHIGNHVDAIFLPESVNTSTTLRINGGDLHLDDAKKILLGNSNNLEIHFDGSDSYVSDVGPGSLIISGNNITFKNQGKDENYMIVGGSDNNVKLYSNDNVKLSTNDSGISVTGNVDLPDDGKLLLGTDDDFQIYYDGGTAHIDNNQGQIRMRAASAFLFYYEGNSGVEDYAKFKQNGEVELYHDGILAFETTSTGIDVPLGTITGPATLNIDPAVVGDNTGTVVIKGDLQVDGTTTTINSTTLTVDDKNIVLASGAANSAAANGAGITIDGANESLTWIDSNKSFKFSTKLAIGSATSASANLRLSKDVGGENTTTYYSFLNNGLVQPDVTGTAYYNFVQVRTDGNNGTGYTISKLEGYSASVGSGTIHADTTITNLIGFEVKNTWTAGTNNYGFRGEIATGTNRWNVYMDGTAPNYFAGNVGIGITDPDKALVVKGANSEVVIDDTNGSPVLRLRNNGTTGGTVELTSSNSLRFRAGGTTERLRITADGDLLVNHDSSDGSGKLQVFTNSQDGIDILGFSSGATAGGRLTFYRSKSTGVGNFSEVADGDSLGRIDWRGYNDDGTTNNLGATIEALVSGAVNSTTDMPSDLVFKTSPDGGASPTERLRITSAGRVGIGTDDPGERLDVRGKIRIEDDSPSPGLLIRDTDASGDIEIYQYNSGDLQILNNATSRNIIFQTHNGTSVGEKLRITSDGRVGIGTDSPATKLEIAGTGSPAIRIKDLDGTSQFGQIVSNNGLLIIESRNENSDGQIVFRGRDNTDTNEYGRFDEVGRFGVGVQNLNSNLHVKGGSESTDNLLLTLQSNGVANDGSLSTGLRLINSTSNTSVHGADIRAIRTGTNTADLTFSLYNGSTPQEERLRITSDGNVQLKTANAQLEWQAASGGDNPFIRSIGTDQEALEFNTGGSSRVRIGSGGSVGIGTDSPEALLDVNGGNLVVQNSSGNSITLRTHVGNGNDSHFNFQKSRGGSGTIADVQTGDDIGTISFSGYFGGAYNTESTIKAEVDLGNPMNPTYSDRMFYDSNEHRFRTNGSTRIAISAAGSVGINTTAPSARLHVRGTQNAGGILVEDSSTSTQAPAIEVIGKRQDGNVHHSFSGKLLLAKNRTDAKIQGSDSILGTVAFGGNHSTGSTGNILYAAAIHGVAENSFDANNDMPTGITFRTGSTGRSGDTNNVHITNERLRITSDGNVGIGTNAPSTKLDVFGAIKSSPVAYGNNQDGTYLIAGSTSWSGATSNWGAYGFQHKIKSNAGGTARITVDTISGEALCVLNNNHIGIGTNNPQGTVHISSGTSGDCELILESDTDNNEEHDNPRIIFKQDGGLEESAIEQLNNELTLSNSVASHGGIVFKTGTNSPYTNATEKIRITPSGQVGVGVSTVARGPLHIHQGTTGDTQIHMTNSETGTSSSDGFTIFQGAGSSGEQCGFVNREENGKIRFIMNTGPDMGGNPTIEDQMVLLSNGNLGVGVSDPTRSLHVSGNSYITGRVGIGTTEHSSYYLSIRNTGMATTTGGVLVDCHDWSTNSSEYGINVDIDSSNRTNLTTNRTHRGISTDMRIRVAQNASNTSGTRQSAYGTYSSVHVDDTDNNDGKMYYVWGSYSRGRVDGINCANLRGAYNLAQCADNATGQGRTVDSAYGTYSNMVNDGNQTTITNAYGVYANVNQDDVGGAMTNAYGVYSKLDRDGGTAGTGHLFRGDFDGTWSTKRGIWLTGDNENSMDGTLSISGSKTFRIPHPLPELAETKDLVHVCIEAPAHDLIYRGKSELIDGSATINLDTKFGMTEGTFVALNRNIQCFTSNESDWGAVRGSVSGNILTIECQDSSSTATISWMVVGERQDDRVKASVATDANGNLILEPDKRPEDPKPEKSETPD